MKKLTAGFLSLLMMFFIAQPTFCATKNLQDGEKYIRTEQLPYYKKSTTSLVEITTLRKIIKANNLIPIVFLNDISTKTLTPGVSLQFSLPAGLSTVQGTQIFPPDTIVVGEIENVKQPRAFNRNAKVQIKFKEIILPCNDSIQFCAVPNTKDELLSRTKWQTALKAGSWTVGGFGVGAGLGAAIGAAASAAWTGCWMGMAIGGGLGVILAGVTPGLHYKAKRGDVLYIKIVDDLSVWNLFAQ